MTLVLLFPIVSAAQTFVSSIVGGTAITDATSIAIGPDQRLYVVQEDGTVKIFTMSRTSSTDYDVTATEIITLISDIENHNDDGTLHATAGRQSTGICVGGTPSDPVIYVTSSDYRVGGLLNGGDLNLDTNSGVISRLTKNGSNWERVDIVRGLPRSEENHATNDLILDPSGTTLFVASGGNTNAGAPSFGFAYLNEFALSASILSVDLTAIDAMMVNSDTSSGHDYIYDIPTVDDPTRSNANGIDDPLAMGYDGVDLHDPFGGNDGLNQAKLVSGGPVQVYATGFRNPYDVVLAQSGKMYAWDNGANQGWGGHPASEGVGTATNDYPPGEPGSNGPGPNDPQVNNIDGFHLITPSGYYAGHPCPIRANPASAGLYTHNGVSGVFRTAYNAGDPSVSLPYDWPSVPLAMAHPVEGDFQLPGSNSAVYTHQTSTNGSVEYTASNFGGAMQGNILSASYNDGSVYRVSLNASGTVDHPDSVTVLASNLQTFPLDVAAMGDGDAFPGTIWAVTYGLDRIYVFEPADFSACTGADNNTIDEDLDGFTNADEIDNGTSPCNGADMPADHDGTYIGDFKVSDLNDPDDDDDGINDTLDLFVWDPNNGAATTLPVDYPLLNNDPGTGFYGLGFTGFMANQTSDYLDLWKRESNSSTEIIPGGAAGFLTFVDIGDGDALNGLNDQDNAFQFGVAIDSTDAPFVASAEIKGPVFPDTIQDFQSMGLFVGTGTQDDYVKLVIDANGGTPNLKLVQETGGVSSSTSFAVPGIGLQNQVTLHLIVNPGNGYVRAQYAVGGGDIIDLGSGLTIQGAFLTALKESTSIAIGIISTARGSSNRFEATWAHVSASFEPPTGGEWHTLHSGTSCNPTGTPGSCCEARHEAAYVQSGDQFILIGGRENNSNVNLYDPVTNSWTIGADAPMSLHHFQAVDYYGLVLAPAAFSGGFPIETPVSNIMVYDPIANIWYTGPEIPVSRRRGSAAAVMHEDTLFVLGGNTNGHFDFSVPWADKYDLRSNTWTSLADAPNRRDHFHAAVDGATIYAAGGRRTGEGGDFWLATESTVDYFDITTQSWDTIVNPLPTPRAGHTVAAFNNELLVIGGERLAGLSNNETEALDLGSGSWRTLDSLNVGRNGTQAIVNNDGIYVASGAGQRGGVGLTKSTEAFYFYGKTDPILNATTSSSLSAQDLDFGDVPVMDSLELLLSIDNTGGNQALLVTSVSLFDGTEFSIDTNLNFPRFIKPSESLMLRIQFAPGMQIAFEDTLYISHSGANAPLTKVVLTGIGSFNWMGATRVYVDSSATGSELGSSWTDAFTEFSMAVSVASTFKQIKEIWVAKGTYRPGTERTSTFLLPDSVQIYGGFSGTETLLAQRDIDTYPVALDGDIGIAMDSTDNIYHVVSIPVDVDSAYLDGVHIQHGTANGAMVIDQAGAGLYVTGKGKLVNCTIRQCGSTNAGSAVYATGAAAQLAFVNMLILDNSDPFIVNDSNSKLIWLGSSTIR